jgi:hypothetical protein
MSPIKPFETKQVRSVWDAEGELWFFSVVDVIAILTGSHSPRKYWSVLKTRLKKEGSELATNCSQLKMESADGKRYLTDVADTEQLLRLVQSIPSPKAEPLNGGWHKSAMNASKKPKTLSVHSIVPWRLTSRKANPGNGSTSALTRRNHAKRK